MTSLLEKQDVAKVLILEDEPSQLKTLTAILEEEAFQVVGCATFAEAQSALEHDSIAVMIVDLCLPDLGTLELLTALEPWSCRLPIIVNTAYGSYESAREAVNLGAFAYVEKAGSPDRLIRHVHRAYQDHLKQYASELEQAVAQRTEDLQRVNEYLRQSEAKYRSIFEVAAFLITSVDEEGMLLDCNKRVKSVLGYERKELIGQSMTKFVHPHDHARVGEYLRDLVKNGYSLNRDFRMVRKDGSIIQVCVNSASVTDREGRFIKSVCLVDDVTERKQKDAALIEYQRQLKALASELTLTEERLRRSVATELHDQISQTLAMSKVKVDALRATIHDEVVRQDLDEIDDTIGKTLSAARSITSRLSYPTLQVLGYEKAVEKWLMDEVEKKHGIATEFHDDGAIKPLTDDVRAVLFRGARELLINSVKHAKAEWISVSIWSDGGQIFTRISDDGVGCDPRRVIHESDGFGLLSVQEALECLGGHLSMEVPDDHGLHVTMSAPMVITTKPDPDHVVGRNMP